MNIVVEEAVIGSSEVLLVLSVEGLAYHVCFHGRGELVERRASILYGVLYIRVFQIPYLSLPLHVRIEIRLIHCPLPVDPLVLRCDHMLLTLSLPVAR